MRQGGHAETGVRVDFSHHLPGQYPIPTGAPNR